MDRTLTLLKEHEYLRSSDKELLLAYWETEGLYLSDDQKSKFLDCTSAETITRCRRAIQMEREDLQATPEVTEARYKRFKEKKEVYLPDYMRLPPEANKLFNIDSEVNHGE